MPAQKIDNVKVVKGRLIRVENTNREFGAAPDYIALQVENADGRGERCLLFTDGEIARAQARANRNPEDLTKKGFITNALD